MIELKSMERVCLEDWGACMSPCLLASDEGRRRHTSTATANVCTSAAPRSIGPPTLHLTLTIEGQETTATMELRSNTVCRDCMRALRQARKPNEFRHGGALATQWTRRSFIASTRIPEVRRQRTAAAPAARLPQFRIFSSTVRVLKQGGSEDLNTLHNRILELTTSALRPDEGKLPTEQRVLYVLEQLDAIANSLIDEKTVASAKKQRAEQETTATSALLGSVNARSHAAFLSKAALLNLISEKAEAILRHPNIFISPAILKAYIDLQSLLHHPSSFPDIFALYASKPIPKEDPKNNTITYTPATPNAPNAAIDTDTANTALAAAIAAHNLPLCLDTITTTFSTPAYKRAKLIRRALIPATLLTATPVLAYTAASQFGLLQTTMDPTYATGVAFAGIMTYTSVVGALGYIVITTANDQMDRVTWAKGVPLWERWVREEERAALDKVSGSWGFRSLERRGEEEGAEWEGLREEVGVRGMVLDRAELMDGME